MFGHREAGVVEQSLLHPVLFSTYYFYFGFSVIYGDVIVMYVCFKVNLSNGKFGNRNVMGGI